MTDSMMKGESIPIEVIKSEIDGLDFAIMCDQGGADYIIRRNGLKAVLDWYNSPAYQQRLARCMRNKDGEHDS